MRLGIPGQDEESGQKTRPSVHRTMRSGLPRFFDPADRSVTSAPAGIVARSYTMAEETKRWLISDHPEEERQLLLEQVRAAEKRGLCTYTIEVPGSWYAIEYGLVRSSGKKMP